MNKITNLTKVNMDIFILRHGKAEEHTPNITSDAKRKLTETGKKELECIAKAMKNLDIQVNDIISSPLIRSKQTAQIALKHIKNEKKAITIWDELKPEMDASKTLKRIFSLKNTSSILLVGHEPNLTNLIKIIISDGSSNVNISLKKGGLVHIRGNITKSGISGILRSIMTPKQLKKLCK